jgi:hypothetical protein
LGARARFFCLNGFLNPRSVSSKVCLIVEFHPIFVTFSFRGFFPYSTVFTHTRSNNKPGEQTRATHLTRNHPEQSTSILNSLALQQTRLLDQTRAAATLKPAAAAWKMHCSSSAIFECHVSHSIHYSTGKTQGEGYSEESCKGSCK